MKKSATVFLYAAMAVPFVYAALLLNSLRYPGYSHFRQQFSELGAVNAPHPSLFNVGVLFLSLLLLVSALGFRQALQRLNSPALWAWLVCLVLALFAVATFMAGWFPLPDSRHGGKFLGLVILLGPPFTAAAVWQRPQLRRLRLYLILTTVIMIGVLSLRLGAGGIVGPANAGLFQRIDALIGLSWISVAACALLNAQSGDAPPSARSSP